VKYDIRPVEYAPEVIANAVWTAFNLNCTLNYQLQAIPNVLVRKRTTSAIANHIVYSSDKVRKYSVCIVKTGENRNDIRTRVCVSLAQDGA
jgi:hypothetical protein